LEALAALAYGSPQSLFERLGSFGLARVNARVRLVVRKMDRRLADTESARIDELIPDKDVPKIFDHFFRCLVTGASDTGKSFFVTQVVFPHIANDFDRVIIFTRDANVPYYEKNTKYFRAARDNKTFLTKAKEWLTGEEEQTDNFVRIVTDLSKIPEELSNIPAEQEIVREEKDGTPVYRYRYLIVFDDIMHKKLMESQIITDLFTHYRHYGVSVFFIAQASSRFVPSVVQNNSSILLITSMEDRDMRNNLLRHHVFTCVESVDMSDEVVRSKARKAYKYAIEEKKQQGFPYGVLIVDKKHRRLFYFDREL
jgi:hypothetical protein